MTTLDRRKFLHNVSMLAAGSLLSTPLTSFGLNRKLKISLVGTGIRGTSFWGKRLVEEYNDLLEFVGLCDINPGRLAYAKKYMGVQCPTFADFDEMLAQTNSDLVIVTTKDSTHHEFIIKGLNRKVDVLTENRLTAGGIKSEAMLESERGAGKKGIVVCTYCGSP